MIFQLDLKVAAESLNSFVACADPFAAEFADEIWIFS